MRLIVLAALALISLSSLWAECPNACSGHGWCGRHDQCNCYKNWIEGDCSLRLCQFGNAYVDTPKGDLDADGEVTDYDTHVIVNSQAYPWGTTEQYPAMVDSDKNHMDNTAHEYVECSSRGYCDRVLGTCVCDFGYSGSACQRAECPYVNGKVCNGHGTCQTKRELATADHSNLYELWDADISMGCKCDSGYYGAACELKTCKQGYDPIYHDAESSVRYSNWTVAIVLRSGDHFIYGNYSLVFTDIHGTPWSTEPISYGASCLAVIKALESLPNRVIPYNSVKCTRWDDYHNIPSADEPIKIYSGHNPFFGMKYQLAFPGNPGVLSPLKLDVHLDGSRPTLFTTEPSSTLQTFVYPNGFQGEHYEYFTEKCVGVDLTLLLQAETAVASEYTYFGGLTSLETRLLQKCLGGADLFPDSYSGSSTIEGEAYTWDFGDVYNPHLVRLVDRTDPFEIITDMCNRTTDENLNNTAWVDASVSAFDGGRDSQRGRACSPGIAPPGFLAVVYYDSALDRFVLMTRPSKDYSESTTFAIWTTTGTVQMVSDEAMVYTSPNYTDIYSKTLYTTNATATYHSSDSDFYQGNVECEVNAENRHGAFTCLEKGDRVFFLDKVRPDNNPEYLNVYTIDKIGVALGTVPTTTYPSHMESYYAGSVRNFITVDSGITSLFDRSNGTVSARAYKFSPPEGYKYVNECSNRGLCDTETGVCSCFYSWTGDDCSTVNNFANIYEG